MKPRISMIALAVNDLEKSVEFYENGLGFPKMESPPEVAFFNLDGTWLGLSDREALADDATISSEGSGYSGINLAHNVASGKEVDDVMKQAIAAGAESILLDNFDLETMQQAVNINAGQAKLEVSGGIEINRLKTIAATGVDYISVGALTKHLQAVDFSMRFS